MAYGMAGIDSVCQHVAVSINFDLVCYRSPGHLEKGEHGNSFVQSTSLRLECHAGAAKRDRDLVLSQVLITFCNRGLF